MDLDSKPLFLRIASTVITLLILLSFIDLFLLSVLKIRFFEIIFFGLVVLTLIIFITGGICARSYRFWKKLLDNRKRVLKERKRNTLSLISELINVENYKWLVRLLRDEIEGLLSDPRKCSYQVYIYCVFALIVTVFIFFTLIGLESQLRELLQKNQLLATLLVISTLFIVISLPNIYLRWSIKAIGFTAVAIWCSIFAVYFLLMFAFIVLGETNYIATMLCYILIIGWLFQGMRVILTELKLSVRNKFVLLSVWFVAAILIAALFYGIPLYLSSGRQINDWPDLTYAIMYGLYNMADQQFNSEINVQVPIWFLFANRLIWFMLTGIYISFIVEMLRSTVTVGKDE